MVNPQSDDDVAMGAPATGQMEVARRAPSLRRRSDAQRPHPAFLRCLADAEGDDWITTDLFLRWKDRVRYGRYAYLGDPAVRRAWLHTLASRDRSADRGLTERGLIPNRQRRQPPYIYTDDEIARIVTVADGCRRPGDCGAQPMRPCSGCWRSPGCGSAKPSGSMMETSISTGPSCMSGTPRTKDGASFPSRHAPSERLAPTPPCGTGF